MEISCPDCAVRYDVPAELVAAARRTRCVRCGAVWMPGERVAAIDDGAAVPRKVDGPEGSVGAAPVAPTIDGRDQAADTGFGPFAGPPSPAAAGPRSSGIVLAAAWTASLLVLLAIVATLIAERRHVVAAWPPAERLYAALGFRVAQGGGG